MAAQFNIDDAFSLEGDEEGVGPEGGLDGWKGREKERDGEMTFGPLSFTKPQSLPSTSASSTEHSNLKYQVQASYKRAHILCVFCCTFYYFLSTEKKVKFT